VLHDHKVSMNNHKLVVVSMVHTQIQNAKSNSASSTHYAVFGITNSVKSTTVLRAHRCNTSLLRFCLLHSLLTANICMFGCGSQQNLSVRKK